MTAHRLVILSEEAPALAELVRRPAARVGVRLEAAVEDPAALEADTVEGCTLLLADPALALPVLGRFRSLQWWQSTWHGVDKILADPAGRAAAGRGLVAAAHGIHADTIAAWVVGYLVALERQVVECHDDQVRRAWNQRSYRNLRELTAGILGTGVIARRVAACLAELGLRVLGYSRSGEPVEPFAAVYGASGRDAFLAQCDAVVALLPLTNGTRGLVDRDWFAAMSRRPLFLNAGRGATVVEADLVEALRCGGVAGAALDVFEVEPLPADSPLWSMPRVLLTPHVAGTTLPGDVARYWQANLSRFLTGEALDGLVDPSRGY